MTGPNVLTNRQILANICHPWLSSAAPHFNLAGDNWRLLIRLEFTYQTGGWWGFKPRWWSEKWLWMAGCWGCFFNGVPKSIPTQYPPFLSWDEYLLCIAQGFKIVNRNSHHFSPAPAPHPHLFFYDPPAPHPYPHPHSKNICKIWQFLFFWGYIYCMEKI